MATKQRPVVIQSLRGGRNAVDPPLLLPDSQAVEALNVDWYRASVARKRGGSTAVSMTGHSGSDNIDGLFRHTPSADEADAESWLVDAAGDVSALDNSASWSGRALSPSDTINASNTHLWNAASFNGNLYLAFDSDEDRLHMWDGTDIRRVGVGTPAAPTVDNNGSGSYTATLRYYKVAYTVQSGGITLRRSELSPNVSFTPSGSGTDAEVTKPTTISEGETHWEVYGSADDVNYYMLSAVAVGTSTYNDSAAPSTYSGNTLEDTPGKNTVLGSAKYLVIDDDRVVTAGSWEETAHESTVFYTPVQGDADVGDAERRYETTSNKARLTLDRGIGGEITGMVGPLNGFIYVFKWGRIYRLVRTGVSIAPYQAVTVSEQVGCVYGKTIVRAVDEMGSSAIYFLSDHGPYRISAVHGLQFIGHEIEDVWSTINLDATIIGHGIYHPAKEQVWFWVATDSSTTPDTIMMFDTSLGMTSEHGEVHGGWAKWTGDLAAARCSAMLAETPGASMSRALKPHAGMASNVILQADTTDTDDNGTAYQAYVKTKAFALAGLGRYFGARQVSVTGEASAGAHIEVTVETDFGLSSTSEQVDLTASHNETRVLRRAPLDFTQVEAIQVQVGDTAAIANSWRIDAVGLLASEEQVT